MSEKSSGAPPDVWGKLPTILAALNPILLLVIGFALNHGLEQTRFQLEENSAKLKDLKTAAETSAITLHDRVDKVKVISDFLNDLSGPDERRRGLAIEAIFIALPDEATRLVKVVENFAAKSGEPGAGKDVASARDALATTRDRLVADMFSPARPTRVESLSTLQRGWTNDTPIVDLLITRAMADVKAREATNWTKSTDDKWTQQLASIYNTTEFLANFHGTADAPLKARIAAFLTAAAPNSDDTRRTVAAIKDKFQ